MSRSWDPRSCVRPAGFAGRPAGVVYGNRGVQRLGGCSGGCRLGVFLGAQSTLPELQGGLLMAQIHRSTAPLEGALDAVTEHAELLAVT